MALVTLCSEITAGGPCGLPAPCQFHPKGSTLLELVDNSESAHTVLIIEAHDLTVERYYALLSSVIGAVRRCGLNTPNLHVAIDDVAERVMAAFGGRSG